ncbi:hypothetical protein [Nocardioides currus]|uniref:DUF4352 domain-containing protein n=1 Tax=Nocardioides currus TaxID=2133958 RepID=A0A2R7YUE6_9ACTN|nr:hypothetical protein [Nocardioides currus]PUA80027.1 hypothetical protein C7S10_15845 [Nocardioides currus]
MPSSTLRTVVVLTSMLALAAAGFAVVVGFFAIGTFVSKLAISNGAPSCPGTTLTGDPRAMTLDPAMRCTMPVAVRNDGRLAVTLDELVLPSMGAEGGAAVQVTSWDGHPTPGGDLDAVFDLDRRLEPGDSWETEIEFRFRPEGCTGRGTFVVFLPAVRAGAWGRSVEVPGPGVLFAGTRDSSC